MGARALTIPTIFSAVDKFSGVLKGMGSSVSGFADKAERAVAKSEKAFKRFTPTLSHAAHELLSFASAAAVGAAIVEGIHFSVESLEQYEESLVKLRLATGASGKEFDVYKTKVLEVAKATGKSAIDVASVFSVVAKSNPELRDNAELLSKVADASILLAKASGSELEPASDALTTVLRRFHLPAEQAVAVTDALAASLTVSKYSITETAGALDAFANTAKAFGISVNQSIALTSLGSNFADAGSEGGKLQKVLATIAGVKLLPKKVQEGLLHYKISLKQLADPTVDIGVKLKALQKIQGDGGLMLQFFGKKQADFAKGLLGNVGSYDAIIAKVNEKGAAEKAAELNEATLGESIKNLKNAWINLLVGNDKATGGVSAFSKAIRFVTKHLDKIVEVVGIAVSIFAVWWAINKVVQAGLWLYPVVLDIITIAQIAGAVAATAWGVAMDIGLLPILAIIAAIAILTAAIILIVKHVRGWGAQWDEITKFMKAVFVVFKTGLLLDFLFIKDAFASMTDAIVLAWEWGQNKIGLLSDEQYAADKASIKANQTERVNAIKAAAEEGAAAMKTVSQGMQWKMSWASDDEIAAEKKKAGTGVINPKKAQQDAMITQMQTINKNNTTTVDFKNVPKGVDIQGANPGTTIMPSLASTYSGF